MKKYIWLFGENLGETANNNSYYFWEHIVEEEDEIEKYFVLVDNKKNREFYKKLPREHRKFIVWKNSIKHYVIWDKSDMHFVSLSYLDVQPKSLRRNKKAYTINKPVIYLQHGTTAMKKLRYTANSYNNNLFKFLYYNKKMKEKFIEVNKFKEYQLIYAEHHPRYKKLLTLENEKVRTNKKHILWFITWREYFQDTALLQKFLYDIKRVILNKELGEYLEANNVEITICSHVFIPVDLLRIALDKLQIKHINIISQKEIDVMQELVKADILITDYSSVAFDFTALNKPVILYQGDLEQYLKEREFYCEIEELNKYNLVKTQDLIDCIIDETYEVNKFCTNRVDIPNKEDMIHGRHIDKMYTELKRQQLNKITFVGYNFYGIGGTVKATLSLAEKLMEKGFLVELISLKRTKKKSIFPSALRVVALSNGSSRSIREKCLNKIHSSKRHLTIFDKDKNKNLLLPISGYRLKRLMRNIKTNTLVSTRESLHSVIYNATTKNVNHKGYFFHCQSKLLEEVFPGVMEELQKLELENALFVTEQNKADLELIYKNTNFSNAVIVGNTIQTAEHLSKEEIQSNYESNIQLNAIKSVYNCVYLVRISRERKTDLLNLIEFAKYLKIQGIRDIKLLVYGTGDYVEEFFDMIYNNNVENIIDYQGLSTDIKSTLADAHCMTDFSTAHSFGMTYIEAVLNGKMVFCTRNTGSIEVLDGIEGVFIESHEDLVEKIYKVDKIPCKTLLYNYEIIFNKYVNTVADNFINGMKLK